MGSVDQDASYPVQRRKFKLWASLYKVEDSPERKFMRIGPNGAKELILTGGENLCLGDPGIILKKSLVYVKSDG